jgi:anhydro-N-acetylmuramic acid kinase
LVRARKSRPVTCHQANKLMIYAIGLMSGTSADGIDAVYLHTDGQRVQRLAQAGLTYSKPFHHLLKAAMRAAHVYQGDMVQVRHYYSAQLQRYLQHELALTPAQQAQMQHQMIAELGVPEVSFEALEQRLTERHAQVVEQLFADCDLTVADVDVIGFHGQTLYHQPPVSIQIGDAAYLAQLTGCNVVYDFRQADLAAGGQGAPLAPAYHQLLASQSGWHEFAVVNCGGITNLSIGRVGGLDNISAGFDCGPGNALIDQVVRQRTQGRETMDRDGEYGLQGQVHDNRLQTLRAQCCQLGAQNYFDLPPPKSLDIHDFTLIDAIDSLSLPDACATLAAFSAQMVVDSVALLSHPPVPPIWVVAGGGWKNPVIWREFVTRLHQAYGPSIKVKTADEVGWHSQTLEAEIFAVAAAYHQLQRPFSCPATTGANAFVVLGQSVTA